jgi:hypothetical protein
MTTCAGISDDILVASFAIRQSKTILARSACASEAERTIFVADAHAYGKRFVVRADEMLTAFLELQTAIHEFAVSLIS